MGSVGGVGCGGLGRVKRMIPVEEGMRVRYRRARKKERKEKSGVSELTLSSLAQKCHFVLWSLL